MRILVFFPLILLTGCFSNSQSFQASTRFQYDTITKVFYGDFSAASSGGVDVLTNAHENCLVHYANGQAFFHLLDMKGNKSYRLNYSDTTFDPIHTTIDEKYIYLLNYKAEIYRYDRAKAALYAHDEIKPEFLDLLLKNEEYQKSGLVPDWFKPGSDQRVNVPENVFYFRVNFDLDSDSGKYSLLKYGQPISARFELKNNSLSFYGSEPKHVHFGTYGLLSEIYDLYKGDSIIFTNPINGDIEVIDTREGKSTLIKSTSRFHTVPVKKFHANRFTKNVNEKKMKHYTLSSRFEALFYNPYNKKYYRVYHPAQPEFNTEGKENTLYNNESVLLVYDEQFKLLYDEPLPPVSGHIWKMFPIENGIMIRIPDKIIGTKEKISFHFLKISHP